MDGTDTETDLLLAGQIADLLGMAQQNVHKWLRHPSRSWIQPVNKQARRGKLYRRADIERARDEWLADEDRRRSDEKRRQAALARRDELNAA